MNKYQLVELLEREFMKNGVIDLTDLEFSEEVALVDLTGLTVHEGSIINEKQFADCISNANQSSLTYINNSKQSSSFISNHKQSVVEDIDNSNQKAFDSIDNSKQSSTVIDNNEQDLY